MEKPITIRIREFDTALVELISNSGLPMWKISDELAKISIKVDTAATTEAQLELQAYNNALDEEKKKEGEKNGNTDKTR